MGIIARTNSVISVSKIFWILFNVNVFLTFLPLMESDYYYLANNPDMKRIFQGVPLQFTKRLYVKSLALPANTFEDLMK